MATLIPKNSATASKVPLPADLAVGEIAFNITDGVIYSKDAGGNIVVMSGAPELHTHSISQITGLQTALDGAVTLTGTQTIQGAKTYTTGSTYDLGNARVSFISVGAGNNEYGFEFVYTGEGSGVGNAFELWTNGQTAGGEAIHVWRIDQTGKLELKQGLDVIGPATVGGVNISLEGHTHTTADVDFADQDLNTTSDVEFNSLTLGDFELKYDAVTKSLGFNFIG